MDLPDCPPGAEGYEDSVIEVPKKPKLEEKSCTKAEQEFKEHLESLKIRVEHGGVRCMVERRGRDVSGKWIYLCYPCAAVCSGESILQTHISGKKHKTKLAMRNVWPQAIFDEHPYVLSEKGTNKDNKSGATEMILQKMAEEVNYHNNPSELETKYNKYRNVLCHIQDDIDKVKAPLLGLEYLVEHPPEEAHYEPSYICTLCSKQGHPRTIINHMTCFWHRYHYLVRHYPKAGSMLASYKAQPRYREGVGVIINRIAQRIEDTYGRLKPVNIDKEEYDREKERIHQWLFKSYHFAEKDGCTFEEVCDVDLIESLDKHKMDTKIKRAYDKRDPSPPVVAAPMKPIFNSYTRPAGRQERRAGSLDALSDISDEPPHHTHNKKPFDHQPHRYEPYGLPRRNTPPMTRYQAVKAAAKAAAADKTKEKQKPHNYDYKVKLAEEQRQGAVDSAKKMLAYHEKNPEKHPLYPEEWKKFWNRRYKEIQAESKDPSKHDFKPEWIVFWTARMKELHDEELRVRVSEIYRKMCLTPPPLAGHKRRSPEPKRRSQEPMRRSPENRRQPSPRRRSPLPRRRSPPPRRPSPIPRRRTPEPRRRSPDPRRRSPIPRRRTPERRPPPVRKPDERFRVDNNRPRPGIPPRSQERGYSPSRPAANRTRSRSPIQRASRGTNFELGRCSRSPLSRRAAAVPARNRSRTPPRAAAAAPAAAPGPSTHTVLISDDELKPDGGASPWNSDNDMESLGSLPEARSPARMSHAGSERSYSSRARRDREYARPAPPGDLGPPENVVATLRLLVALEDYLGSVGPKLVDLLTDALRMEKEKANSSEDLLVRDSAVVLMETAKEKLKGAVQAGLVPPVAAAAVRAAVVRTAATLHEADTRARNAPKQAPKEKTKSKPMPVAGVGDVDRAQIAQQMAAALIAQGKTDVTSEELAQLVDAVVGMAEAKKREAVAKPEAEPQQPPKPAPAPKATPKPEPAKGAASALQMLQSAYDENDKKADKEEAPDAMDGLSDSDLETLLKNFNELSAEEQHSLIAYLKKLEARSPLRVERLRQYVGAAAAAAAAAPALAKPHEPEPQPEPEPEPEPEPAPVTIESDDDDYTVEEVFQSATQKVKEDQLRQEMEIVKKSLEETKTVTLPTETKQAPVIDLAKNLSSASDLLALVQASIQSTAKVAPTQATPADVVTSNTQPRSFGDLPEPTTAPTQEPTLVPNPPAASQAQFDLSTMLRFPMNPLNFAGNLSNQNDSYDNQGNWNQRPIQSLTENLQHFMQDRGSPMGDNRSPSLQDIKGPLLQDNRGPLIQNTRGPLIQDNRGPLMQDNRGSSMQDNRGSSMQDNRGPPIQDNRGPPMQDNRGPPMQDNRGPLMHDNRGPSMQDNRGPSMQDNRGPFMQDNRGPSMQDNRGPSMQDNRGPSMQDNRGSSMQDNRGPPMQDNWGPSMQDNRGPSMQDNRGPSMQDNRGPSMQDNRGPSMQDNRGPSMQDNMGNSMSDNRGPSTQENRGPYQQDNRGSYIQDNRSPFNMQDNRGVQNNRNFPMQNNRGHNMQDNSGPLLQNNPPLLQNNPPQFLQNNQQPFSQNKQLPYSQNSQQPYSQNNQQQFSQNNRGGPSHRNFGHNQGPRPNFMNGRMQDNNFDSKPDQQQQFGNFDQSKNFRGRGGGRGGRGGPMRGRGRGGYY